MPNGQGRMHRCKSQKKAMADNIADGNSCKHKLTVLDFIDTAADPAVNKRNMDVHGEYSKAAQPTRCQASRMDMFAEAVLELRSQHPDMILEMVSPFDDQAARWSPELRARHDRLFAQADITTATGHAYTRSTMFRRKHYLVDNADLLLAAYGDQLGGTVMTCELARRYDVPIMKIKLTMN